MERYTDEERLVIVRTYMDCGQNIAATLRKIENSFDLHKRPSRTAVVKLVKKFKKTGSVSNAKRTLRTRSDHQADGSNNSIRITSQELGISSNMLQRILLKDLNLQLLQKSDIYFSEEEHKLMLFKINRAARIIQRFWLKCRLKSKKSS